MFLFIFVLPFLLGLAGDVSAREITCVGKRNVYLDLSGEKLPSILISCTIKTDNGKFKSIFEVGSNAVNSRLSGTLANRPVLYNERAGLARIGYISGMHFWIFPTSDKPL